MLSLSREGLSLSVCLWFFADFSAQSQYKMNIQACTEKAHQGLIHNLRYFDDGNVRVEHPKLLALWMSADMWVYVDIWICGYAISNSFPPETTSGFLLC